MGQELLRLSETDGFTLVLAFSAVMILIMDLDRPGQSLFQVSQQSMAKLLENMD